MATGTNTTTGTVSKSFQQARVIMGLCLTETSTIVDLLEDVPCDFNLESNLHDVTEFILNGVALGFTLNFYNNGRLLVQYEYKLRFSDGNVPSFGPPANQPPIATDDLPSGTRCRLNLIHDPECPKDYADAYIARLGWKTDTDRLSKEDLETNHYGCFGADGFGMDRRLKTSRSITSRTDYSYRKDTY